ncbi:MAG: hypothetical protein ACE5D7_10025 [Fidelibacterota bacterium]
MKLLLRNMESYEGTAIEIVRQMMGSAMFADNKSVREYMDMVMKNAKVHHDIELNINGDTDENLARSLVFQIVEHGMGIIMDNNGDGETK